MLQTTPCDLRQNIVQPHCNALSKHCAQMPALVLRLAVLDLHFRNLLKAVANRLAAADGVKLRWVVLTLQDTPMRLTGIVFFLFQILVVRNSLLQLCLQSLLSWLDRANPRSRLLTSKLLSKLITRFLSSISRSNLK